ncbi:MAG: MATE family efflux transporter [Butyrivibrio sp.]|jgi:putative MATE family efflux protein|nr:MATE family efflux transporter [Butyrivibrio sp.]
MANSVTKDLTVGSPMKLILGFSLPLLGGTLFQQLYNLIDTMIVGKFLGKEALAGVGSTGAINFMIIGFCMGVCSGFAIPISQRFGAKDYVSMRRFAAHSIYLSVLFAAVMTFLASIFCRQILELMNTPSDVIDYAYSYILIIFIGIPVIYMYNLLSGILRALGDSRHPVIFVIVGALTNIALDLFCILNLHMGVAGAAVATVISQLVSGVCCLVFIVRKIEIMHIRKSEWKIDYSYFYTLFAMGVPMGLQYSITAIGSVILQVAINGLGSDAVAAVTAASKVSMFFCCPFDAMGSTMATYGGQNVGARKLDRLGTGLKACIKLGVIYSVIAFVVLFFFGDKFAMLFISASETSVLAHARLFLILNSAFYIPLALVNIVRFMIQGMGFSMFAILAGVCEMAARTLVALFLVPVIGFTGICLASPFAWICADLFLIPAFLHVRKQLKKMFRV